MNTIIEVIKHGLTYYAVVVEYNGKQYLHTALDQGYLRKIVFDRYDIMASISSITVKLT